MAELPSGTVTFLFTDIEGSTTRWAHQPEAMGTALARHEVLLRAAIREHDSHVVKTMGDAFHAVFVRAPDAVAAALDAQRGLQAEPWGEIGPIRVRMPVHTDADRPCEQGGCKAEGRAMTAPTRTSAYDQYADEYAAYVATREQDDLVGDPFGILTPLLAQLGDVTGQDVLDAGCGEGYLSRILAARGARVTGVDLSPRLVELAGQKASPGPIEYRVGDLSVPHPELEGHFNAVASFFVLNDVEDHRGFAETLARSLRPGGRAVLGFNNPYDYVMRKGHGSAYFTTGGAHPCGLSSVGVPVFFYHRTLPQYLDAFLDAGLCLTKIVDVDHPAMAARRASGEEIPLGEQLPRFMVLAFSKL